MTTSSCLAPSVHTVRSDFSHSSQHSDFNLKLSPHLFSCLMPRELAYCRYSLHFVLSWWIHSIVISTISVVCRWKGASIRIIVPIASVILWRRGAIVAIIVGRWRRRSDRDVLTARSWNGSCEDEAAADE